MKLDADRLVAACGDESQAAGLTIRTELEPLGGPGAPVKPAVYLGGQYQTDRRWVGDAGDRRAVDAIVVDNVPSQANRLEAGLERHRDRLGLPLFVLDLSELGDLPAHLPRSLSSLRFPHRNADAYLRDSTLDGTPFGQTEIGKAVLAATADRPEPLLQWFPQALLFGFWQPHLGKKGSQAKLARSWVSEIVGLEPAQLDGRRLGLKGDPLNLSGPSTIAFDDADASWATSGGKKALSDIGHGQVPVSGSDAARSAVSFRSILQQSTLSLASLRNIRFSDAGQQAAGRAVLAALGIVAHVGAFGSSFFLRSECDLRTARVDWHWIDEHDRTIVEPPTFDEAVTMLHEVVAAAEALRLPVGTAWAADPVVLRPGPNLADVIRAAYPSAAS